MYSTVNYHKTLLDNQGVDSVIQHIVFINRNENVHVDDSLTVIIATDQGTFFDNCYKPFVKQFQ